MTSASSGRWQAAHRRLRVHQARDRRLVRLEPLGARRAADARAAQHCSGAAVEASRGR